MPHVSSLSHPSWEYPKQPGPEMKRGYHPGQRELLQGRLARPVQRHPEGEHERDERGCPCGAHPRRRETKLVALCVCVSPPAKQTGGAARVAFGGKVVFG